MQHGHPDRLRHRRRGRVLSVLVRRGGGDQGADPNKLVEITDRLDSTDPATAGSEHFRTIEAAHFGEVLRGISFTPGTSTGGAWGWGDHTR
jgi:hypothetical protein